MMYSFNDETQRKMERNAQIKKKKENTNNKEFQTFSIGVGLI